MSLSAVALAWIEALVTLDALVTVLDYDFAFDVTLPAMERP